MKNSQSLSASCEKVAPRLPPNPLCGWLSSVVNLNVSFGTKLAMAQRTYLYYSVELATSPLHRPLQTSKISWASKLPTRHATEKVRLGELTLSLVEKKTDVIGFSLTHTIPFLRRLEQSISMTQSGPLIFHETPFCSALYNIFFFGLQLPPANATDLGKINPALALCLHRLLRFLRSQPRTCTYDGGSFSVSFDSSRSKTQVIIWKSRFMVATPHLDSRFSLSLSHTQPLYLFRYYSFSRFMTLGVGLSSLKVFLKNGEVGFAI